MSVIEITGKRRAVDLWPCCRTPIGVGLAPVFSQQPGLLQNAVHLRTLDRRSLPDLAGNRRLRFFDHHAALDGDRLQGSAPAEPAFFKGTF